MRPLGILLGCALLVWFAGPFGERDGALATPDRPGPPSGAQYRIDATLAERDGAEHLSAQTRRAGLRFGPEVAQADREAILAIIAGARPEARALVGLVDGVTTAHVGPAGHERAVGHASDRPGDYEIVLDLAQANAIGGQRALRQLVLHELGHIVDFALVTNALMARFDAATPAGYGCGEGVQGGCAPVGERFADSFAKWATGDIGVNIYLGYTVPPPSPAWGELVPLIGR